MNHRKSSIAPLFAGAFLGLATLTAGAAVITFDDLPYGAGNNHEFEWNGIANAGFTAGTANFSHAEYNGFAYSKETDTTTAGYLNQYSAYTGGGADGSASYAIGYAGYGTTAITYTGLTDLTGTGASITNTTYAALSMQEGDFVAKKFGGATGNDEDWFKLTITGFANGVQTGTVDFYLADFRDANNANDYILSEWTFVDFSGLGTVDKLEFTMSSSDNDPLYGMNTPAYFAIDNVPVPEPSAVLCSLAGLGLFLRRRR